jgi:mersacidin/lichenicidin family type 2 lantibiotic
MGDHRTIRAWKDAEFRAALGDEAMGLAPSPVGAIELADEDLGDAAGGAVAIITQTTFCATSAQCATLILIGISNQISCGACDTTLWHGTCAASSIGCC